MSDDRRAALEAAFDAVANEGTSEVSEATQPAEVLEETSGSPEASAEGSSTEEITETTAEAPVESAEATETAATEAEPAPTPVDEPPTSWKAVHKAKWSSIDPEIRSEILRRDREISSAFGEVGAARNFAKQFTEAVAPFAPRLQAMGAHPLQAVHALLKADYILATGAKQQRAELIAKLIKDYDVDIGALDNVLAGVVNPAAQEEVKFQRILEQHLAPLKEKLSVQEQREQIERQQMDQELTERVEAMAVDPKFPHFNAVRETMADLIEINARRGVSLSVEEAYNRAVIADPQLAAATEAMRQAEAVKRAAEKAQRAKLAASSVKGSPTSGAARSPATNDRRATIAAAFDALGS